MIMIVKNFFKLGSYLFLNRLKSEFDCLLLTLDGDTDTLDSTLYGEMQQERNKTKSERAVANKAG